MESPTEGDILNLGECFKTIMNEKSELILKQKKAIMILYSIFVILDNSVDNELIEMGRSMASDYIDEFILESS